MDNERFYWVISYDDYGGFMALSDREVNVLDSDLSSDFILCKDRAGLNMILHWAAVDLIDELSERDPQTVAEFLGRIRT